MNLLTEMIPYLRCCAGCGKSLGKTMWLCLRCEVRFISKLKPQLRLMSYGIQHFYLMDWYREDLFLKRLVHSLKGGGLFETYTILSQLMFAYFPIAKTSIVFYPSRGVKDHAFQLATEVSNKFQYSSYPLYKSERVKQSLRRRGEREKLQFVQSSWRGSSALLVDDIVTSGSTVRACYKAINRPQNLTVWSLFYRKDL